MYIYNIIIIIVIIITIIITNFMKSSYWPNMRLWHNSASEGGLYAFIKSEKKLIHHKRILGNLTTYVRKPIYHLPTFAMNAGNHGKKVHVARSIFCVICVFNIFWVAGTLICVFSVK